MRATKSISVLFLASAALGGCTVGPDFLRPSAPDVMDYTAKPLPAQTASADIAGGDAQRFLQNIDVPAQWWTQFNSPAVNEMVDQALKANPDLAAAQASLRQAAQNYLATRGQIFPQVNGGAGAERERVAKNSFGGTAGDTLNLYNASVSVSYAVDAFGGIRRSIEASAAAEENQRFQVEATYLTLISNVITAGVQEGALIAEIAATQDIITAESQELDLLNQQFELGAVARGDVLAQQSQLALTQATLPPLQKQLETVRNTLSTLLGRLPSQSRIPDLVLTDLKLPQDLPLSLPSKLVEQRPDVRASEALLHQASAEIGVATANQFPQITLSGTAGSAVTSLPGDVSLFSAQSFAWSLAADVVQPIFRGGTLEAEKQAAVAAYDRASAQYRGTVLSAFANVANVLSALELDAEALKVQLYAEQTASQNLDITRERFQAGAIAYLSLLDAERTYQQARIERVIAQANRYADTVALFEALGGGWWNRNDIAQATPGVPAERPAP